MTVKLICLPGYGYRAPSISMSSLYTFLQDKGLDVSQSDYSIAFIHSLIGDERISEITSELLRGERSAAIRSMISDHELELFTANRHQETISKVTARGNPARSIDQYLKGYRMLGNLLYLLEQKYGSIVSAVPGTNEGGLLTSIQDFIEHIDDKFIREFFNPFLDSILSDFEGSDLVGISIVTPMNLFFAIITAKYLKERMPGVRVVVGGPLLSFFVKQHGHLSALRNYFDFIVVYEGETALCELHESLEDPSRWPSIPNLIYPSGEGYIFSGKRHIEDIDSLPTPRFEGVPLDKYFSPDVHLPLAIAKSCPYKCAFCGYNSNIAGRYRERSPDKIAEDIAILKRKYDAKTVMFCTSYLNPESAVSIARGIIERGLDIAWTAQTRPESGYLKEGVLETLRDSGCISLEFGVESASKRVLKLMNKDIDIEDVPLILKRCDELGMLKYVFILFGFPGERLSDLRETIGFIREHHRFFDYLAISDYELEFNSLVWDHPERYGVSINYSIEDFLEQGVDAVDYRIKGQTKPYRKKRKDMKRRCMEWLEQRGFICLRDVHVLWSGLPPSPGWQAYALARDLYVGPGKWEISEETPLLWKGDKVIVEFEGNDASLLHADTFAAITISKDLLKLFEAGGSSRTVAHYLDRAKEKYGIPRATLHRTINTLALHGFFKTDRNA